MPTFQSIQQPRASSGVPEMPLSVFAGTYEVRYMRTAEATCSG
jgi:hypothetical protein